MMEKTRIMKRLEVQATTGLSRSGIYALIDKGSFPSQIKLGPRSVGWVESEIQAWLHNRIAESRGGMSHA